jgi:hypothetical protein
VLAALFAIANDIDACSQLVCHSDCHRIIFSFPKLFPL